jgi:divergent AAA domain protein
MYNTETVEDYIYRLIDERESSDVEFKSGKGGFPKEFWPTYSAFANTNGGTIVLGVVERKDSFSLAGLSLQEIEHLQKELWRQPTIGK